MFNLSLISVTCTHTGGSSNDPDDVMVVIQTDAGPPFSCPIFGSVSMVPSSNLKHNSGSVDVWQPTNVEGAAPVFYFTDVVTLNLYDRDGVFNYIDSADFLCGDWFDGSTTGRISRTLSGAANGARYSIVVQVDSCDAIPAPAGILPDDPLYTAIQSALSDFKASNALFNEILEITDPKDMKEVLEDAIVAEAFTELSTALLDNQKIKAVSLGLMGQVDLFGGVAGSFGIAFDRADFSLIGANGNAPTTTIFGGAGFVEGVDAGIQGTLALGVWFEASEAIGGVYIGAEVDVDDDAGFTVAAFADRDNAEDFRAKDENGNPTTKLNPEKKDLTKVVFVGLDVGIDDGIEAEEAYFFAGQLPQTQCYQTGDYTHIAVVKQITCNNTKAPSSNDNVGIRVTVDGADTVYQYPFLNTFEMDDDDDNTLNPAFAVKFNESFWMTLYAKNGEAWDHSVGSASWSTECGPSMFNQNGGTNNFKRYEDHGTTDYDVTAQLL